MYFSKYCKSKGDQNVRVSLLERSLHLAPPCLLNLYFLSSVSICAQPLPQTVNPRHKWMGIHRVVNRSDLYSTCVIANLGTNYLSKTSPSLCDGNWMWQLYDLDSTDKKDIKRLKSHRSKKCGL